MAFTYFLYRISGHTRLSFSSVKRFRCFFFQIKIKKNPHKSHLFIITKLKFSDKRKLRKQGHTVRKLLKLGISVICC